MLPIAFYPLFCIGEVILTSAAQTFDVLATVDLGSNSFRLQISRVVEGQLFTLDSLKESVRLGAGLGANKLLDEDTQQRALSSMARFGERLRAFSPKQVRIVGTNTLRVAKNAPQFIEEAERLLGFPIEIIAGREEARLIYLGASHSLPNTSEKRLVVDIGGGSTEFIIGRHYDALKTESLPLGCVSYTMRYFKDGKLTQSHFEEATFAARAEIQRLREVYLEEGWQLSVGTSGTARCLRDVLEACGWSSQDITYSGMLKFRSELVSAGQFKKVKLHGLKPDRAPVIPGGLAIMIGVFEELGITHMTVADGALRDGVLYDLMGRQRETNLRDDTVALFCRRYHVDTVQASRVEHLAEHLYRQIAGEDVDPDMVKRMIWTARLHEIGLTIAHTAFHKHAAYIVQNADMPGFSRKEQSLMAVILQGQRGDLNKMVSLVDSLDIWYAVIALRLAVLFYRSRNEIELPSQLDLKPEPRGFSLTISADWLKANPLTENAFKQERNQWKNVGFVFDLIKV